LTPDEAWCGKTLNEPAVFRTNSSIPYIQVHRRSVRVDPCLPSIDTRVAG